MSLKIYDASGRLVETLVNGSKEHGYYNMTWAAKGFPAGVYFAKFEACDYISIKKLILM
ncbi:MAG: T9SS type A sorting domain-containing protein [bacterium]|nr:T9SS type A sorting domain-containing protein [bacterium]